MRDAAAGGSADQRQRSGEFELQPRPQRTGTGVQGLERMKYIVDD